MTLFITHDQNNTTQQLSYVIYVVCHVISYVSSITSYDYLSHRHFLYVF